METGAMKPAPLYRRENLQQPVPICGGKREIVLLPICAADFLLNSSDLARPRPGYRALQGRMPDGTGLAGSRPRPGG